MDGKIVAGIRLLLSGQFSTFLLNLRHFVGLDKLSGKSGPVSRSGSSTSGRKMMELGQFRVNSDEVLRKREFYDSSTTVAVIIPVFNDSQYLSEAVTSCLRQTHRQLKIYIVDDGSSLNVLDGLEAHQLCDERVKFLRHDQNYGLAAARNTGVIASTEKLIQFLDADDLLAPWSIERRIKMLQSHEGSCEPVCGAALPMKQVSSEKAYKALDGLADKPGKIVSRDLFNFDGSNLFPVHSPLVTRDVFDDIGFFDEKLRTAEDYDFWSRCMLSGYSFLQDKSNTGGIYRLRLQGMVLGDNDSHLEAVSKILRRNYEVVSEDYFRLLENIQVHKATARSAGIKLAMNEISADEVPRYLSERPLPSTRIHEVLDHFESGIRRGYGFGPDELQVNRKRQGIRHIFELVESSIPTERARLLGLSSSSELRDYADLLDSRPAPSYVAESKLQRMDFLGLVQEEKGSGLTSVDRLEALKNKHFGETCVLVGNGPSLNLVDPSELSGFVSFGVNSIWLKPEISSSLDYYTVEDTKVMSENLTDISNFLPKSNRFFPSEYESQLSHVKSQDIFFRLNCGYYGRKTETEGKPRFSLDPSKRVFAGQSVTFINMQLAYWMGFSRVLLVGMDFSYEIPAHSTVNGSNIISGGPDPNHFHPDYFGEAKTWKKPRLDRVQNAYELAKSVYESDGREIINATEGGKLEVFPRGILKNFRGGREDS